MPSVYYILEKQTVEADPAETILQASLRVGIPHAHACGGNARCSTCRVVILEGLEYCVERNDRVGKTINATLPGKKGEYALYEVLMKESRRRVQLSNTPDRRRHYSPQSPSSFRACTI